jgi:hypothetical protein
VGASSDIQIGGGGGGGGSFGPLTGDVTTVGDAATLVATANVEGIITANPAVAAAIPSSEIGAANGVAPLDANSLVPLANLPIAATSLTLTGSGAPSNTLGLNGDYYIDAATGNFYGPKASGAWPATTSAIQGRSAPLSGTIAADVTLTGSIYTNNVMATSSLAVGTWLITMGVTILSSATANVNGIEMYMQAGTATCSIVGKNSGQLSLAVSSVGEISITTLVVVTVAGTVVLNAYNNDAVAATAKLHTTTTIAPVVASGWTATRVA